jgi:hypothetical protein
MSAQGPSPATRRNHTAQGPAHRGRRLLACMLGALLLCGVGVAVAAVKAGTYTGITSEKEKISFKVSSDRRHILGFTVYLGYNGKCGQGGGPSFKVKTGSIALTSHGSFTLKTKAAGPVASVKPVPVRISGRISGRRASGNVVDLSAFKCSNGANPYAESFTAQAK